MGIISGLNKAFENRIRLGVMSILMVNHEIDFNTLKEMLEASDGNIASHIAALEKAGYINIEKKFIGKKTNTSYSATSGGKRAFQEHLNALENLIKR
ncbi:MAG: DNA-binding MarR family transcriptional regulator [Glaciecola sp.]|jgi:DNA-binding MarR family transcriptional regulator